MVSLMTSNWLLSPPIMLYVTFALSASASGSCCPALFLKLTLVEQERQQKVSELCAPPGDAVGIFSACSEQSELSRLTVSSADTAGGFWEVQEGVQGAGDAEREGSLAGRSGVLAAGPGSPGVLGAPLASPSSTVSRLSCRERSADVDSNTEFITEDPSVSGPSPAGGAGLWRVTPSSPLMVSTRRLHDRPK